MLMELCLLLLVSDFKSSAEQKIVDCDCFLPHYLSGKGCKVALSIVSAFLINILPLQFSFIVSKLTSPN